MSHWRSLLALKGYFTNDIVDAAQVNTGSAARSARQPIILGRPLNSLLVNGPNFQLVGSSKSPTSFLQSQRTRWDHQVHTTATLVNRQSEKWFCIWTDRSLLGQIKNHFRKARDRDLPALTPLSIEPEATSTLWLYRRLIRHQEVPRIRCVNSKLPALGQQTTAAESKSITQHLVPGAKHTCDLLQVSSCGRTTWLRSCKESVQAVSLESIGKRGDHTRHKVCCRVRSLVVHWGHFPLLAWSRSLINFSCYAHFLSIHN